MSNSIYCVYITFYSGNNLPPFYIGSTSIDKIDLGYRGSVQSKRYKKVWREELNKFPQKFKTKILSKHATKEEALLREEAIQRKLKVVENPLYTNLCIAGKLYANNKGKIFSAEHKLNISKNHVGMTGRKHREETKNKMSYSAMGNKNSAGCIHSIETKRKISIKNSGKIRSRECCEMMSKRMKGKAPWNRGILHSEETKNKISQKAKMRPPRKWFNDGVNEMLLTQNQSCSNLIPGRLPRVIVNLKPTV